MRFDNCNPSWAMGTKKRVYYHTQYLYVVPIILLYSEKQIGLEYFFFLHSVSKETLARVCGKFPRNRCGVRIFMVGNKIIKYILYLFIGRYLQQKKKKTQWLLSRRRCFLCRKSFSDAGNYCGISYKITCIIHCTYVHDSWL